MKREIIKIDEEKCNGCGLCIPNCHEGALQIVDGKARLISDLMCDGLGACIGNCPQGAITIEKREAEAYNETLVMEEMITKGKNTVIAHLKYLKDHNEQGLLKEGMQFLKQNEDKLDFEISEIINAVMKEEVNQHSGCGGGCPGSAPIDLRPVIESKPQNENRSYSALRQWPVQMHLINPTASYFKNSDLLLAGDCAAYSCGNFHSKLLNGKTLAIACPKLDQGQNIYLEKLTKLIDDSTINTLTVTIMEVPCCGGLLQIARTAIQNAKRNIPLKLIIIGIDGNIIKEEWV